MSFKCHRLPTRWIAILSAAVLLAVAGPAAAADTKVAKGAVSLPSVQVAKTATCGCCRAWVDHMRAAGFEVTAQNMAMGELSRLKAKEGIVPRLASCHTAKVGGYVIEGHVPAKDVERLLQLKPDAIGLSVPGMPMGSPGMEMGSGRDAYDVVLINKDGSTSVFSTYEARK